jgi:hypothetical protein
MFPCPRAFWIRPLGSGPFVRSLRAQIKSGCMLGNLPVESYPTTPTCSVESHPPESAQFESCASSVWSAIVAGAPQCPKEDGGRCVFTFHSHATRNFRHITCLCGTEPTVDPLPEDMFVDGEGESNKIKWHLSGRYQLSKACHLAPQRHSQTAQRQDGVFPVMGSSAVWLLSARMGWYFLPG